MNIVLSCVFINKDDLDIISSLTEDRLNELLSILNSSHLQNKSISEKTFSLKLNLLEVIG